MELRVALLRSRIAVHCCVKDQLKFTLNIPKCNTLHCFEKVRCSIACAVVLIKDCNVVRIKFQSASSISLLALL